MPHRTDILLKAVADAAHDPEDAQKVREIEQRSQDGCSWLDALTVCAVVWKALRGE